MQRVFIKDCGRYKKGMVKDYPLPTWNAMAKSLALTLNDFAKPVDEVISNDGNIKQPFTQGAIQSQGKLSRG